MLELRLSSAWPGDIHTSQLQLRMLLALVLASSLCVSDHKFYSVFFFKHFLGHLDKLFCLLEQLKIFVAENGNCVSSQHDVSHCSVQHLGARLSGQSGHTASAQPTGPWGWGVVSTQQFGHPKLLHGCTEELRKLTLIPIAVNAGF